MLAVGVRAPRLAFELPGGALVAEEGGPVDDVVVRIQCGVVGACGRTLRSNCSFGRG